MRYKLGGIGQEITGEIELPSSKSISNRLLILDSLASERGELENLSESDDTRILQAALGCEEEEINAGHAGTAMRFLTAYLSISSGKKILTGSERMRDRPIGQLVDALNSIGAEISYTDRKGYPPLSIRGKLISGGQIAIDSSVSSQFISALMMIGPSLNNGLEISLENEIVSSSYIRLTANLMKEYGLNVDISGTTINIPHTNYTGIRHVVEADWSAASYWYSIAALSEKVDLSLRGLRQGSFQGDSVLPELFEQFGVETKFTGDGVTLSRRKSPDTIFEYDFRDCPDLVQTMVVLCGLTERRFYVSGTQTLQIKETERISALKKELQKLGVNLSFDKKGKWISWDGKKNNPEHTEVSICTYQDHRMAMAFAPAAIRYPGLIIEDPNVVSKSYPGFWKDLEQVGFKINKV
jgi:3-phosphoshikimate 1-carboxyvinyltransferase